MKNILKLEELGLLLLSIYLFDQLTFAWWWFPVLLPAPDISMLGYLGGNRTGAFVYNLFHHKGIAITVYLAGLYTNNQGLALCGVILLAHASMDRIFGYGLKYVTGFKHTHLGTIGQ